MRAANLQTVADEQHPITADDIVRLKDTLLTSFPNGIDLTSIIPACRTILTLVGKERKMSTVQKRDLVDDLLCYVVDTTDSGPTLDQLDPIIKQMIPAVLDALMEKKCWCL